MGLKRHIVFWVTLIFFKSCVFGVDFCKQIDERDKDVALVGGSDSTAGCTHNVLRIVIDGKTKYFKEAKEKSDLKSGVESIIDEYCDNYDPKATSDDKALLKEILFQKENFKKLTNIGCLWIPSSRVYRYLHDIIDSDELGIPNNRKSDLNIDLKSFFTYVSKELMILKKTFYLTDDWFVTNQIATYRLAEYLGISEVVVGSESVELVMASGKKKGLLTEEADGLYDYEIRGKGIVIMPEFQRQVSNLEVLDTITGERDHKSYNLAFKVQDDQLIGITAFDCENCFGYLHGYFGEDKDKVLGVSHMDRNLADKILSLTEDDLENVLRGIIPSNKIGKLKNRIESIKNTIRKAINNRKNFLLDEDGWSKKTLEDELRRKNSLLCYLFHELNLKR